jgi:methylaspartate ammonia-lyase
MGKAFWMCDDIFGLKPNWVQQFNAELKQRKLDIKYYIQSRVDLLLKEDNIDALAESGLEEVWAPKVPRRKSSTPWTKAPR